MKFDVFISYSSKDATTANAACAALEAANIRCWIAPRDIVPGARWGASIVRAINECRVMVLIFSRNANASEQVHREVDQAFSNGKPVMPLRVENVRPADELAYYLNTVHWLDALTPPLDRSLQQLTAAAKALLTTTESEPAHGKTPLGDAEATRAKNEADDKRRAREVEAARLDDDNDAQREGRNRNAATHEAEIRQRPKAEERAREGETKPTTAEVPTATPLQVTAKSPWTWFNNSLADGRPRFAVGAMIFMNSVLLFVASVMALAIHDHPGASITPIQYALGSALVALCAIGLLTMKGTQFVKWIAVVLLSLVLFLSLGGLLGLDSSNVLWSGYAVSSLLGMLVCLAGWLPLQKSLVAPRISAVGLVIVLLLLIFPFWTTVYQISSTLGSRAITTFVITFFACTLLAVICSRSWAAKQA